MSSYNGGMGPADYRAIMGGNNSGKRDAMGRFTRSGGEDKDVFATMQKMADMTADHTEREMIMRLMERLRNETNQ